MTCNEARISLGAYTLGSLDTREDAEVRSHLESCSFVTKLDGCFCHLPAIPF